MTKTYRRGENVRCQCIEYWLDETSDHDDPRWIVSLEEDETTETLRVLPASATEREARTAADTIAHQRGLAVERRR